MTLPKPLILVLVAGIILGVGLTSAVWLAVLQGIRELERTAVGGLPSAQPAEPAITPSPSPAVASPLSPAATPKSSPPPDVAKELPAFCAEAQVLCSGTRPTNLAEFCRESCALCGNCTLR